MTVIQQAQATENAYQAGRQAEGARQAFEAAKKAEAARVLNQGTPGLAQIAADPYVSGISQEDMYKLALAKQAQEANIKAAYDKLAADRFNASKQYAQDLKTASTIPQMEKYVPISGPGMDDDGKLHDQALQEAYAARDRMDVYNKNVDPGLAAKWTADRAAFK